MDTRLLSTKTGTKDNVVYLFGDLLVQESKGQMIVWEDKRPISVSKSLSASTYYYDFAKKKEKPLLPSGIILGSN